MVVKSSDLSWGLWETIDGHQAGAGRDLITLLWRTSYKSLGVETEVRPRENSGLCFGLIRFEWTSLYLCLLIYQNIDEI